VQHCRRHLPNHVAFEFTFFIVLPFNMFFYNFMQNAVVSQNVTNPLIFLCLSSFTLAQ